MPSQNLRQVPITPPRVPLTDSRTGLIDRAWYMFFLSLYNDAIATEDILKVPDTSSAMASFDAAIRTLSDDVETQPSPNIEIAAIAEINKQLEALAVQPQLDLSDIFAQLAALRRPPVTKTTNFTLAANEQWVINNKAGSTCTVTLPPASAWSGREVTFQNYQPQLLISASSDVVPLGGGSAATGILLDVAGNWATMVSDGSNWIIMQAAPNNILLLE